ncbi:hypothetical protein EJ05DRAFT_472838 [Pseudovirgaria hyperparasitica]|uniref:Uncharacterized protein n=1 Tax=Pseudovirgaria hyperparasitica TaxID=470096 RepID=A0A6A6WGH0_9PEZI|nr:uncharacterized protein EJ05DRAFT_472838 [Pseudovirgaria hyperparasitica]KAF2761883.1 hypothetical protein EJ05DRAFT_472838 [Pseudovirgaria hyperparasitica]
MQASRPSTPQDTLPSSPPSAPGQTVEDLQPFDHSNDLSPSRDQWSSPANTLGHSSPELPPLPSLPSIAGIPRTPSAPSVPKEPGSYYTTSWGSPYRQPSPGTVSERIQDPEHFGSDDLGSESSEIEFGLDHLLPSRVADEETPDFGLDYLLPALVPALQATPTAEHFASLLAAQEATPRPVLRQAFRDLLSQSPEASRQELLRKFVDAQSKEPVESETTGQSSLEPTEARKGHKKNLTLKQEDFWSHFGLEEKEHLAKMMASRYASKPQEPEPESSQETKELVARQSLTSPVENAANTASPADQSLSPIEASDAATRLVSKKPSTPIPTETALPISPSPVKRVQEVEERAPTPPPKRPRKVIKTKKGRSVVMDFPIDSNRGKPGHAPMPLSHAEVRARLAKFEDEGYDTRGFGHWRGTPDILQPLGHAQNRDVFPDPTDQSQQMSTKSFKVHIPNENDWKAYQDFLVEQKLAALGVSLGGSEEVSQSQSPTMMSRQGSSQYPPLPFSPPLPSSSAGSQRIGPNGSGMSGHQSTRSIASPMSAFGNSQRSMSSHMHRNSMFAMPSSFAPQATPPGGFRTFSPHESYFGSQATTRGGSPGISQNNSMPSLNDTMSPVSPFGFTPQTYSFPQKDDLLAQLHQQRMQSPGLTNLRPSSTLQEVPEEEAEEEHDVPHQVKGAETEMAVPKPRHQHNISENLQRDVESADYHLEATFEKDVASGGQFSPGSRFGAESPKISHQSELDDSISEWRRPRPVEQVLHQPQPHNRNHSLTQTKQNSYNTAAANGRSDISDDAKTNISEITNPSAEEKAVGARMHSATTSQGSNIWKPGHGSRASKASIGSSLNASAKEFKFNPTASFQPGNFSFNSLGFEYQPSGGHKKNSFSRSVPYGSAAPFSFNPAASSWNVAAPSFTPGASLNSNPAPSGDFNFASSGPAFKPDSTSFRPNVDAAIMPEEPAEAEEKEVQSHIFGPINFSHKDIIKPAKRSKAVPIIRPDAVPRRASGARSGSDDDEIEEEDQEDADGRVTQSDARQKRARRFGDDGDTLPKFAPQPVLASQPLSETTQFQASKQEPQVERSPIPDAKENLAPTKPVVKEALPAPRAHAPADIVGINRSSDATPVGSSFLDDSRSMTEHDGSISASVEKLPERPPSNHAANKSSLSAIAKEFTPRIGSGSGAFEFGLHVTKPSDVTDIEHNSSAPNRQVSRSPTTTFRPSDDGSYRTALSRRPMPHADNDSVDFDSFAQPSFNDIDEVMKHMNDAGSDFGVEKEEAQTWERSSQPQGSMDFGTPNLRPNFTNLRSDAPSPSPRRMQAPTGMRHGESELIQDPFSDSRAGLAYESPVHRLNTAEDAPVSDWDDMVSDEAGIDKLQSRARFFDHHVDGLIDSVLSTRLGPLEETMRLMQESVAAMSRRSARSTRRSYSTEPLGSDADDEDDDLDEQRFRNRSPLKDRKLEKIRSIVVEALASQQQQNDPRSATPTPSAPPLDLSEIYSALADVKVSLAEQRADQPKIVSTPPDLTAINEAIAELKTSLAEQQKQHQAEVLAAQPPAPDFSEVHQAFAELKSSLAEQQRQQQEEQARIAAEVAARPVEPPAPAQVDLSDFYSALSDFKLSMAEKQSLEDTKPKSPQLPSVNTKELYDTINDLKASLSEQLQIRTAMPEVTEDKHDFSLSEVYQALAAMKVQLAHSASNHVSLEDFKDIMEEALRRQHTDVDQKNETFKALMHETLERHHESTGQHKEDLREIMNQAIARQEYVATQNKDEIREFIEEAFERQDTKEQKKSDNASILENEGRIADLEAMIKEASIKVDQEREARETAEKREEEAQRLLKLNDEEINIIRESLRDEESKTRALHEELHNTRSERSSRQVAEEELRRKFATLQDQNEALEATIDEYRLSSNKWRDEMTHSKSRNDELRAENEDLKIENDELKKTSDSVKLQLQEVVRVREGMRVKIEKLQYDMTQAAGSIAEEKSTWQKKDEEHRTRYEVLRARIEAEARTRERLERELERLETQEREGMRLRVKLEHTEQQLSKIEESSEKLRNERDEHERNAARYEREFREARHMGQTEVQRTRRLMEADLQAANNEINMLRSNADREKQRLQADFDNLKMDYDQTKARYEVQLEEALDARRNALNEAYNQREAAIDEVKERHERIYQEIRNQHARALENVREDSRREETHLKERLNLSNAKLEHLEDQAELLKSKAEHLESQLKVARDAANAAALTAASVKSPAAQQAPGGYAGVPEKVSPQALRESIVVLQEQLQERETRIESFERQLEEIDTEAPAKLKERDTEIGWLRELLGVRVDDISELINALGQPNVNREAVRDAAIRIRTNLQMEQQEKERLISGNGNSFPTLSTLSNLATPKAAQLAAAFGNWRKGGRDSRAGSTASIPQLKQPQLSNALNRSLTPSRPKPSPVPSHSQSILSGLMTPPASNVRRASPQPHPQTMPQQSRHQHPQHYPEQPSAFGSTGQRFTGLTSKQMGKQPAQSPSTPPLLRESSYDQDPMLRDEEISMNGFYDDEDSVIDGGAPEQELGGHEEEERGWEF